VDPERAHAEAFYARRVRACSHARGGDDKGTVLLLLYDMYVAYVPPFFYILCGAKYSIYDVITVVSICVYVPSGN
jgi:hypothetical protein